MNSEKLKEEIEIELNFVNQTILETKQLLIQIEGKTASTIEKTAAAAFLSQIYSGIEKILLRICKYNNIEIPSGSDWHITLFKKFCEPTEDNLPLLIDSDLSKLLIPYRKFRHFFVHGYGILIDVNQIIPGLVNVEFVCKKFADAINKYLSNL